ncbi:hypothetical protein FHX69_6182 [Prauserella muralis]|nr:hypothetical protein FHX69_6182 [Prauserella muralis]
MVSAGLAMLVVAFGAALAVVWCGALREGDDVVADGNGPQGRATPGDRSSGPQAPSGTGSGIPGQVRSGGTTPSTR